MVEAAVSVCAHAERIRPWSIEERARSAIWIIKIHPVKILINKAGRFEKIGGRRRINAKSYGPLIAKETKEVLTQASMIGGLDSAGSDTGLTVSRRPVAADRHRHQTGKRRKKQPDSRLSVAAQQLAGCVKAGQSHVSRQKGA